MDMVKHPQKRIQANSTAMHTCTAATRDQVGVHGRGVALKDNAPGIMMVLAAASLLYMLLYHWEIKD